MQLILIFAALLTLGGSWGCTSSAPQKSLEGAPPPLARALNDSPSPPTPAPATFRLVLSIQEILPLTGGPYIHSIAPNSTGGLWLGGSANLRGLLTPHGFSPLHALDGPADEIAARPCVSSTVTQSVMVRSDDDVYFAGYEYCDSPTQSEFIRNSILRYDGHSLVPVPSPVFSSSRTDVQLRKTPSNRILATAVSSPSSEQSAGSLHELTANGWKLLLTLPTEHVVSPIEDSHAALWVAGISSGNERDLPARILRTGGSGWIEEAVPAYGGLALASDGTLLFHGLNGLWIRQRSQWVARPAPKAQAIITILAHSESDMYFLTHPAKVIRYDGANFVSVPIDGLGDDSPTHMVWMGDHLWLASARRVWKLGAQGAPKAEPIVLDQEPTSAQ